MELLPLSVLLPYDTNYSSSVFMILALAKKSGEDIFDIEFAFLDKLTALKDKHLNEDIKTDVSTQIKF